MQDHRIQHPPPEPDVRQRALLLWPRLDPVQLARTHGHPGPVVRLVARRTPLDPVIILAMLLQG